MQMSGPRSKAILHFYMDRKVYSRTNFPGTIFVLFRNTYKIIDEKFVLGNKML